MSECPKYFDPRALARLKGLELRARTVVEGYVAGMHRSPYRGFSVEFAEHREYVAGDDLRYVDWKVFGKTDKFYLKQYEQETNLIGYLLLDISESMSYRSDGAAMSKLEYAQCAAAALAHLILQQQDAVGFCAFDNEARTLVRPSGNPSHWKQVLHAMSECRGERKTSTGAVFHDLAERLKKRGVVVILSDLFDDVAKMMAGLAHFRHRRHEVIVLQVLDPAEIEFPFERSTLFRGLEQMPDLIVDPRSLRKSYLQEFGEFLRRVRQGCRERQIDYVPLRTDAPLDLALSAYLASRMART